MAKYRKKSVVIEAMQFTEETKNQVADFVTDYRLLGFSPDGRPTLVIETVEGFMAATIGDWVIKGVKGEFYPCQPDIFQASYDFVEE
jgi:hypothetical protein